MIKKKQTYRMNFLLSPTKRQEKFMDKVVGADRWIYNSMLAYSEFAYQVGEPSDLKEWKSLLPELKQTEEYRWLNEIPSQVLQESVINLDRAYKRFFKGLGGYPKFKKKRNGGSFQLPQPKIRMQGKKKALLFLPILKTLAPIKIHREIDGEIKGATITKSPSGKWNISLVVHGKKEILRPLQKEIGVDLGIKDFAIMSSGEKVSSPKFLRKSEKRLKALQVKLSRKKKGSKNFIKQSLKIAKLHERVSNQRKDFLNKLSTKIVNENQIICLETLKVKNMVKNSKLSKSISDAGWGMFVSQLKYKSQWRGRSLRLIDQWSPSTKMCSECGFVNESLTLSDREWACESCNVHHDRDINAAKNILKIGRDTPEYKPVEKLASVKSFMRPKQAGSAKQEPKVSMPTKKSA